MIRQLRYILVLCLFSSLVVMVNAQEDLEVFTFESGVHFTIPADGVLDASSAIPVITLADMALIDVVEPSTMGDSPDATLNLPLGDVMDFLLSAVGFEGTRLEEETISLKLLDGREALVYEFTNATENYQLVFVIRLSDGRVGALNIRALETLPQEQITSIGTLANSFDSAATSAVDTTAVTITEAEALLIADLTEEFTYDSGVSFRYSTDAVLIDEDDPPVTISINDELLLTMVDPNLIGMPSGEPMENILSFAVESSDMLAEDFESIDIGGREAVFGAVDNGEFYIGMALVAFADGKYGIIDILIGDEPTDEQIDLIRSVAASFNSASAEIGITRTDIEEARSLFEAGMAARDEADFEGAVDLFTQAIDLNPDLAMAYYWRASSYKWVGQLEDSVTDYLKTIELEPNELQIRVNLGDTYALMGELDLALDMYQSFFDLVDEDSITPENLSAFEAYQAVANGEYVEDFYFFQANQLRIYGLFDEALESNQVVLDNSPNIADFHSQRGVILKQMGNYEEAIEEFTIALEIDPLPQLFYNRGVTHRDDDLNTFDSMVAGVHDLQCMLLLADDTIDESEIDYAEQAIMLTIIESDDYEPITDPANCVP